jgi:hypothetical protein
MLKRLARASAVAAVVAVMVLACSVPAKANLLVAFSGNTQPSQGATGVEGTVNFAVYDQTTGGSAGDTFGVGLAGFDALFAASTLSGPLDTSARYLYLYQTVNNSENTSMVPISANTVQITPSLLTSWGRFDDTTFASTVNGSPAGFGDPSPSSVGAIAVVTTDSGLFEPTVVRGSASLLAFYLTAEIPVGSKSELWGYTSDFAPIFGTTGLIDGGTTADGTVPTAAVPEPSTLAFALCGVAVAGLGYMRRARRTAS